VGVPQSSIGAPIPLVLSDGMTTMLGYYLENTPASWDGTWVQVVDATTDGAPVAIVRFNLCHAHYFGHPNDEAFTGHPLAKPGLTPYGASIMARGFGYDPPASALAIARL
jgi:hypothetical protein